MKFPFKLRGRKQPEDDDGSEDDADFEDSGEAPARGADAADAGAHADEVVVTRRGDGDDDDDDEREEGDGGGGRKRLILVVAAAAVVVLAMAGGGTWWLLGGGADDEAGASPGAEPGVPVVSLAVPPRGGSLASGMSPPGGDATLNTLAATQTGPGAGIVIPSVTDASYATLPAPPPSDPLPPVPDPALIEQGDHGPLPKIGPDGRKPWQAYARSYDTRDSRPRIAVVVGGLGLSRAATQAAITRLPAAVTLAFDPYATGLDDWVEAARRAGHEVLIELPMEPADYPLRDPGPYALMTSLDAQQNLDRLRMVLSRISGYVGVSTVMGSRFLAEEAHIRPVLDVLKQRGLMLVDGSPGAAKSLAPKMATAMGVPRALADVVLDEAPSRAAIDARLVELENRVRDKAVAVAFSEPYPVSLERLATWAATLEGKNIALAPVSALADKQFLP